MMGALGDKVETDKDGNEVITPSFNSVLCMLIQAQEVHLHKLDSLQG